ncbi:hypothetical protein C0989_011571, partial [Termitomyces sp. Mn162]
FLLLPMSVQTPRMRHDLNILTTTLTLIPAQPWDPSSPGNPLSNSGPAPITREASTYPAIYLHAHKLALTPALGQ